MKLNKFAFLSPFLISQLSFAMKVPDKREFPTNASVNPCEDFHQYVCSNVDSSFRLPKDRSYHSFSFSDASERILESKKDFFRKLKNEKKLDSRTQQLQDFYVSCMNETASKKSERSLVAEKLTEFQKMTTPKEFLSHQISKFFEDGESSVFNFGHTENTEKTDEYLVLAYMSFMNLPERSYYKNAELKSEYIKLLEYIFKKIDTKSNPSTVHQRIVNMVELEQKFAEVFPLPETRRQRWTEKRNKSQEQFLKDYSDLNLDSLFSKIPKNIMIKDAFPESWIFIREELNEKNLQSFKDFWLYKSIKGSLEDAYPEILKKRMTFNAKFFGSPMERPPRDERCTEKVESAFNMELDSILIDRLFPGFPEKDFVQMAEDVRKSILEGIDKNQWLSKDAKKEATEKIRTARLQLVKPRSEKEWNFTPLRKYSAKDPFSNSKILAKAEIEKMLQEIPEKVNKDVWGMGPLTINAYYDPSQNKFVMPMGILQYPFYNPAGDRIENLGAVGTIIAHELGHAVDDQGSRYDSTGKVRQWMTMKDLSEFSLRTQKLITQFDKAGHNGKLTLGENVADLVGVNFALNAAFKNSELKTKENYKKFFTAYARLWCYVSTEGVKEHQIKTDSHSLGEARINEQVKHQSAFSEAFQCKETDKMVLKKSEQISIW